MRLLDDFETWLGDYPEWCEVNERSRLTVSRCIHSFALPIAQLLTRCMGRLCSAKVPGTSFSTLGSPCARSSRSPASSSRPLMPRWPLWKSSAPTYAHRRADAEFAPTLSSSWPQIASWQPLFPRGHAAQPGCDEHSDEPPDWQCSQTATLLEMLKLPAPLSVRERAGCHPQCKPDLLVYAEGSLPASCSPAFRARSGRHLLRALHGVCRQPALRIYSCPAPSRHETLLNTGSAQASIQASLSGQPSGAEPA